VRERRAQQPLGDGLPARAEIATLLTAVLAERLRAAGRDSDGAAVWAQGLVGSVQSAGDCGWTGARWAAPRSPTT